MAGECDHSALPGCCHYFVFRMNGSLTEKKKKVILGQMKLFFKFELKKSRISLLKQSRGGKPKSELKNLRALLGTFKILNI